ncbi:hypothetical protein VTN31DRAFT_6831 [Thermomyces dupontii]|uniref:uncharacterized protein n=1 Tax=Talaromyces thermophilus TaxID=28565 RepID=UPI0037428DAE
MRGHRELRNTNDDIELKRVNPERLPKALLSDSIESWAHKNHGFRFSWMHIVEKHTAQICLELLITPPPQPSPYSLQPFQEAEISLQVVKERHLNDNEETYHVVQNQDGNETPRVEFKNDPVPFLTTRCSGNWDEEKSFLSFLKYPHAFVKISGLNIIGAKQSKEYIVRGTMKLEGIEPSFQLPLFGVQYRSSLDSPILRYIRRTREITRTEPETGSFIKSK